MNKRGYAYFVEIALAVIIVTTIFVGFLESEQEVFNYKEQTDLREMGWYILKNLNIFNLTDTSNFSKLEKNIRESLPSTVSFDLDFYNSTGCYSVNSGSLSSNKTYCNPINVSTERDVVSVFYTTVNNHTAESIRLYLWRIL